MKWNVLAVENDYVELEAPTISGSIIINPNGSAVAMIPTTTLDEIRRFQRNGRGGGAKLRSIYSSFESMAASTNPIHRAAARLGVWSLAELGQLLDFSVGYLARVARGDTLPSPTFVKKIADVTGDSISKVYADLCELYEAAKRKA